MGRGDEVGGVCGKRGGDVGDVVGVWWVVEEFFDHRANVME